MLQGQINAFRFRSRLRRGIILHPILPISRTAVLLLDEIDSIAKRRSDESDVGELKRLVTAILQEVDNWPETGLLLAATNHPELIDPALWRRFGAILTFGQANPAGTLVAVERFMDQDLSSFGPWVGMLAASLHGRSLIEPRISLPLRT